MLYITVPARNMWDEESEEFISVKEHTLQLEHSLVSLSKWESKWHKPFLNQQEKTNEEMTDYIKCMTISQNVNPLVYKVLTEENVKEIDDYIKNSMTATTFSEDKTKGRGREIVTSELIYYWMITLQIPFKCEKWHLNRLLTLVRVCEVKNAPPKRRSKKDMLASRAKLNAARRSQLNSKG